MVLILKFELKCQDRNVLSGKYDKVDKLTESIMKQHNNTIVVTHMKDIVYIWKNDFQAKDSNNIDHKIFLKRQCKMANQIHTIQIFATKIYLI